jgi:hypothetical protein
MECIKCDKKYKSQKTLDIHMKRMHPVEDVEPDVVPEVKTNISKEEQNHNCDTCIKCKDDINFLKTAVNLLIHRHVENIQFMKYVLDKCVRYEKNFGVASSNFKFIDNNMTKTMETVEFLMKEYNKND